MMGTGRILVVGDDPTTVDTLTSGFLLLGQETTIVQTADGESVIKLLLEQRSDLVVLDLALRGKNSFETLWEIRRISDVPVILLTTLASEADELRGLESGADACIPKPISPLAFLARVRAILRRAGMARPQLPAQRDGSTQCG